MGAHFTSTQLPIYRNRSRAHCGTLSPHQVTRTIKDLKVHLVHYIDHVIVSNEIIYEKSKFLKIYILTQILRFCFSSGSLTSGPFEVILT